MYVTSECDDLELVIGCLLFLRTYEYY
uniref:Uncharacterized protein n=1 Tax=Rhizophora mucronata TaxID=61149 RepID=A0A2P2R460_RHIMU